MRYVYLLLLFALPFHARAAAAPNSKILEGYHHSAWGAESGIGAVYDVQQAPDGFLWLTTSAGVFRFDGVTFLSIDDVSGGALSNHYLDSVFVGQSGDLWLTTRTAGLERWSGGRLTTITDRGCAPAVKTEGVGEARDGSLWVLTRSGLAHVTVAGCREATLQEDGYTGGWAAGLLVTRNGTLWVKAHDGTLLKLAPGARRFETVLKTAGTLNRVPLREAPDGSIWTADEQGIRQLFPSNPRARIRSVQRDAPDQAEAYGSFMFADDGALWTGSKLGIVRYPASDLVKIGSDQPPSDVRTFSVANGLSSASIARIVADREGSIWLASTDGLDQFRATPLHALPLVSGDTQLGVVSTASGEVFAGSRTLPLVQVNEEGEIARFPSLQQLTALRSDSTGALWIAGKGHLWNMAHGIPHQVHYPGEGTESVLAAARDRNGEPWILLRGGLTYKLHAGSWERQDTALGRKDGVTGTMMNDRAGNIWLAYSNRLARWDGEAFSIHKFVRTGFRLSVYTLCPHGDHVWMGGGGGLVLFADDRFYQLRFANDELPGRVTGIAETSNGDLWLHGYSGITHVKAAEMKLWQADHQHRLAADTLDALDGLPGLASDRNLEPSVVEASDGNLWFATTRSVAWLDPAHLARLHNPIAPLPVVTKIEVNGAASLASRDAQLGPHLRSLRITFTAPSLLIPERVHFRYKLEGVDQSWQEGASRREATYNDLPPGRYTFRLQASNNDGVWSEPVEALAFRVRPAWFQTRLFYVCCSLCALGLLWMVIHIRSRMLLERAVVRTRERIQERERIARELHDTLLQSIFGLMLQFDAVVHRLPVQDAARGELDRALAHAEAVMRDGRERVRDLRSASPESGELATSLETFGSEFAALTRVPFHIAVSGRVASLRALVQEEVFLIAREAITNAYKHAKADAVWVDIRYARFTFTLSVLDDGQGIGAETLARGFRPDHWGLTGMRERAQRIGARFKIVKPRPGGTHIEVRVPARRAYERRALRQRAPVGVSKVSDGS